MFGAECPPGVIDRDVIVRRESCEVSDVVCEFTNSYVAIIGPLGEELERSGYRAGVAFGPSWATWDRNETFKRCGPRVRRVRIDSNP